MSNNRSATMLRAFAQNIQSHGMTDAVAAHLPPASRQLFLSPPLATEWMEQSVLNDVYEAVGKIGGRDAVRRLLYESTRDSLGPVLKPMVDVTFAIHGRTPPVLFTNLDRILRSVLRETQVVYVPEGPKSGVLEVHYQQPVVAMLFPGWEGVFAYFLDLTGARWTISPVETNPQRTLGRMRVSWE